MNYPNRNLLDISSTLRKESIGTDVIMIDSVSHSYSYALYMPI
jgi:hypothetical protein